MTDTVISSAKREVVIGFDRPFVIIGERINPTGRKIMAAEMLADDFSLYLHRPSASDPDVAPPGCDGFYVLSPVPHLGSGTDWESEAEAYHKKQQRGAKRIH